MKIASVIVPAVTLAASLAAPAAHAAPSTNPAPTGSTTVVAHCTDHRVEPKRVIIACGDGGLFLGIKRYKYWSATSAVGYGAVRQNDCDPDCAGGTYAYTKARIRFYHPVSTTQGEVFTRAIATYRFHGTTKHQVYYLMRTPFTPES